MCVCPQKGKKRENFNYGKPVAWFYNRAQPFTALSTKHIFQQKLQVRREWQDIFKVLKGKNLQPRLLYPARISFKIDGEIGRAHV